jgi:hypothetical protein
MEETVTFWLLSSSSSYYIFVPCLMLDNWCSAFLHDGKAWRGSVDLDLSLEVPMSM